MSDSYRDNDAHLVRALQFAEGCIDLGEKFEFTTDELTRAFAERLGLLAPQVLHKVVEQDTESVVLFDQSSRRIPQNLQAAVCNPNTDFHLVQPEIDYTDRLARFKEYLGKTDITSTELQEKTEQLLEQLSQDESVANLKNAVHLPVILSKQDIKDYGQALEQLLASAGRAYQAQFPNREFYNHRKGTLKGQVRIVHASHGRLVERTQQEQVVALCFPNPLQGYSINASREQMTTLPDNILLTGGFDTVTAMAMYPDVLARDWHTPGLDMAALSWKSSAHSLYFWAYDDRLDFDYDDDLGDADGFYSAGLVLVL